MTTTTDRSEFFRGSPHVARVQEMTVSGRPGLKITPAGVDPAKKGDRAMSFVYHAEGDRLVWESGSGSVSDACYGHCRALCDAAKAAGMTVEES